MLDQFAERDARWDRDMTALRQQFAERDERWEKRQAAMELNLTRLEQNLDKSREEWDRRWKQIGEKVQDLMTEDYALRRKIEEGSNPN